MSLKRDTKVDSNQAPIFGADTEELHLLRQLYALMLKEEELSEDVAWVLEALKRVKKKKKN
jgi:hypothetical protein